MEVLKMSRYGGWLYGISTLFAYQDTVGRDVVEQV
jgi:hypothetical protein